MQREAVIVRWLVAAQLVLGGTGLPAMFGEDDAIPASLGTA